MRSTVRLACRTTPLRSNQLLSGLCIGGISARRYLFQAGCRAGQRLAGNRTGAMVRQRGDCGSVTQEESYIWTVSLLL